jgi:hypothetical protein
MSVFTVACILGAHRAAAVDGCYTYVESTGKNNDPTHVLKVEDGTIHTLDVAPGAKFENGYLSTVQEFSNMRIHAEYKWDTKRSTEGKRNSGLLYLAVGLDAICPISLECQIEETDVGDLWIVNGASVTAFPIAPTLPMNDNDRQSAQTIRSDLSESNRILKSGDFEDRTGWNTVEIILDGDQSTPLVNGHVVNFAREIKRPDPQNPTQERLHSAGGRRFGNLVSQRQGEAARAQKAVFAECLSL